MKYIVCLFALLVVSMSYGQVSTKNKDAQWVAEANELIQSASYAQAIDICLDVLEKDDTNETAQLKLGELYFIVRDYKESQRWYEAVLQRPFKSKTSIAFSNFYNYAELLLMEGRTEDAAYWYELYGSHQPEDGRVAQKIEGIKKIPEWKDKSSKYNIEEVSVNSSYNDFAPAFYQGGLVFVSDRDETQENKAMQYFDLYFSPANGEGNFTKPVKLSKNINTDLNEGPISFYDNDRKVVFTRNIVTNMVKSAEERRILNLQLFYSEKESSDADWNVPTPLSINDKNYSMGHPSLSKDSRYLYFSSRAPDGFGGTDLYVSEWKDDNWSTPRNLGGTINTEGNEMFPFIYNDSLLYFASDGLAGLGGLDIYIVNLVTGEVENPGGGINSSKDDFGLIRDGDIGYFSSNRKESKSGKNDDIYKVTFLPDEIPPVEDVIVVQQDSTAFIEIVYTVQILALKNPKPVNKNFLKDLKGVLKYDGKDGLHRYTYGSYKTLEEATTVLDEIKSKGYNDAFIRREARYAELSKSEGIEVDKLYNKLH